MIIMEVVVKMTITFTMGVRSVRWTRVKQFILSGIVVVILGLWTQ